MHPLIYLIILYHNPHKNARNYSYGSKDHGYIELGKSIYTLYFALLELYDIAGGTTKVFLLHVDIHKYLHELLEYLYAGR